MAGYSAEVLVDGPSWYWKMNTTSGDDVDVVAGAHLTPAGGVTQNTTGAFTPLGTGWQFDGSNDYAAASINLSVADIWTFECWRKPIGYGPGGTGQCIVAYGQAERATGRRALVVEANDAQFEKLKPEMQYWETDLDNSLDHWADTSPTLPSTGTWLHEVFVIDTTNRVNKYYQDGAAVSLTARANVNVTYHPLNSAVLYVATSAADGYVPNVGANKGWHNCAMGHLAIYPFELSSGRVAAHYAERNTAAQTAPYANVTITA